MATLIESIYDYLNGLVSGILADIIIAIIIVLVGFILGRILARFTHFALERLGLDHWLKEVGLDFSLSATISLVVAYIIYIVTIILALNSLGLTTTVLWIIVIIIGISLLIALLFGIRDFVPNFFAGLHLIRHKVVKKGDSIKIVGVEGEVVRMSIIETELETTLGDHLIVPNALLTKSIITKRQAKHSRAKSRR